jgi:hypothetical protein
MKRKVASLILAGLLVTAASCSMPETLPVNHPLPVATVLPSNDLSARCIVGISLTTVGVITTVGTAGVLGVVAWGATAFGAGMTLEECWYDANTVYQTFTVQFTCDYVHYWTEDFGRFVDVSAYIQSIGCFTAGSSGGGGGGGGGGW